MSYSYTFLKKFLTEIYKLIRKNNINISEIWCKISDLSSLSQFNEMNLKDIINNFDFLSITKGNYIEYLVINKLLFFIESFKFLEFDIRNLSDLLDYSGFEALIQEILSRNNYFTLKNFRFTDHSDLNSITSQKRYEIDVIGKYSKYVIIIDAKQWKRRDSYSALNKAADLQNKRVMALKKNPNVFIKLMEEIMKQKSQIEIRFPLILIPVIVTLEDNSNKLNYNQIPLVSIYEFNAFLQELPYNLQYFKKTQIDELSY